MNIEEAQEALESQLSGLMDCQGTKNNTCSNHRPSIMRAADAYGAARELKGHVGACQTRDCTPGYGAPSHACGDDWLCDKAREIEAL